MGKSRVRDNMVGMVETDFTLSYLSYGGKKSEKEILENLKPIDLPFHRPLDCGLLTKPTACGSVEVRGVLEVRRLPFRCPRNRPHDRKTEWSLYPRRPQVSLGSFGFCLVPNPFCLLTYPLLSVILLIGRAFLGNLGNALGMP